MGKKGPSLKACGCPDRKGWNSFIALFNYIFSIVLYCAVLYCIVLYFIPVHFFLREGDIH